MRGGVVTLQKSRRAVDNPIDQTPINNHNQYPCG